MPDAREAADAKPPEVVVADLVAAGGVLALLGDRDPLTLVEPAALAAGKPFEHVDARGLVTQPFDRLVRGFWHDDQWELGALTRVMQSGGVFLLSHGETLLDDLRQRMCRTMLTQTVMLRGPAPTTDRTIEAAPGTAMILHIDDHQPVLLQVYTQLKQFPQKVRADVHGPPPVERR